MYRFNIRCLLTVAICFLVTISLCFVVCNITFPAVCIALTCISLIWYSDQISNGIQGTNVAHSVRSSRSPGAHVTSPHRLTRPVAVSNDRASVSSSSGSGSFDQSPNSNLLGQSRLRSQAAGAGSLPSGAVGFRCEQSHSPCGNADALPSRHACEAAHSQASPVHTTADEHSNRNLNEGITTANVYLGHGSLLESVVKAGGYSSSSISPDPQLPESECPVGSDATLPELFPYAGQISRSTADEIVTHPTHQSRYGSLGVLPLVHLSDDAASHTISNVCGNRSLGHGPVTVKIAMPDPLVAPVQFIQSEGLVPSSSQSSTGGSTDESLAEKRKRSAQHDAGSETSSTFQQQSYKRRKLDSSAESASSTGRPPVAGTGGSNGMNLKRPALADIRAETDAPKQRRVQPPTVPSPTSQPGAAARNTIDASYTSSKRWLSHKVVPDICQDTSQRSPVATESRSAIARHPRTSDVMQKSSSKGQVIRSNEEEEHFPSSSPESSPMVSRPSGCRNSSSNASRNKSDIERDRSKELKRVKYLLDEESDLIDDTEPGLCDVSSSPPLSASLPQVATSGLQPATGLLSVADSVSPVAGHLSTCTAAPSVQHSSTGATAAVYSTPSHTENAQIGTSLRHLPVVSLDNTNPSASLNSEGAVSQSFNPTSTAFSVISTVPPTTTLASPLFSTGFTPATGPAGGFKFDPLASNTTSVSSFAANPSSVSNAVGGFKFVPGMNSTSAASSSQFSQCVTTSEIVSDIKSTTSSNINSAAVFIFGQTTAGQALSFSQPHSTEFTSTSVTSSKTSSVDTKNQSLSSNAVDRQSALASNSAYESQLKSTTNNAGTQQVRDQNFGAFSTSALTFGAQPTFGTFATSQPFQPINFGSQQAVTNSFSIQPTTTTTFNNQSTSVNPFMSTPMTSANSISNSKASTFSFTSPTSVNLPSNSEASALSFNNPTSAVGISNASFHGFSYSNPTSMNSLGTSGSSVSNSTSLNLFGSQPQAAGQFANQGNSNNSASGFGGLPSHSDVFGNQQLPASNSFNFGTPTTLENVFQSQAKSTSSFPTSSTGTNIFGNVSQTGGFGSYAGLSAPTCLVSPFSNPQFAQAQPQFSQAQFSFPSGDLNSSSVPSSAFQFPYNVETTSVVTSTQQPTAPNPFGSVTRPLDQLHINQFNAADVGLSQLPNNSSTMNLGQFPTQPNQFSTAQPPFAPQALWTPRFSLGTDNSNSAKNRPATKSKLRKKP